MPHDPINATYVAIILALIVTAFVAGIGVGMTIASDRMLAALKGGAA